VSLGDGLAAGGAALLGPGRDELCARRRALEELELARDASRERLFDVFAPPPPRCFRIYLPLYRVGGATISPIALADADESHQMRANMLVKRDTLLRRIGRWDPAHAVRTRRRARHNPGSTGLRRRRLFGTTRRDLSPDEVWV
jgi:hypothetical protein